MDGCTILKLTPPQLLDGVAKMEKLDFKKEFKSLYNPSPKEVVTVDVPEFNYLMIDGVGDPNTSQGYMDAVEALFAVSYALKFAIKKGKTAVDYGVLPLEGLWWADDINSFAEDDKAKWRWTAMIMQPRYVTKALYEQTLTTVKKKKALPALSKLRFEAFHEGLSAQIMHIGPYAAEKPTIEKIHAYIKQNGYILTGKHHEIYLGDPRKTAPEKLKTVLRQPMKKA
jgi:hypothetical protein